MTAPQLTRTELVHAMVSVGTLLTGPKPLAERMTGLCVAAVGVMQCDHVNVMVIDGDRYRSAYHFGYSSDIEHLVTGYSVSRQKPIVQEIEACESYLLFNDAKRHPAMERAAQLIDVESVVIVPFTHPDGRPFGYLTVDYTTEKRFISVEEAELAMGLARIAQTTLLRDHESQRRREASEALISVEEAERRQLSTDLHDDPLQRILGLRLGLESLKARVDDADHKAELARFIEQCRSASTSLREVMVRTHPTAVAHVDLQGTLQTLVARGGRTQPLAFEFSDERTLDPSDDVTAAIHRIAQQAVRNVLQHANASSLLVCLQDHREGSALSITDDGDGFDASVVEPGHLGLVSMRERAAGLGGTFMLQTSPTSGTKISVWLPHL